MRIVVVCPEKPRRLPQVADAPLERLRMQLNEAIRAERYEEAATLRDQIRAITGAEAP